MLFCLFSGLNSRDAWEVGFAEESEGFSSEDLAGECGVVDGEGDGGCAVGAEHEWVGEVDVQLGAEEVEAESLERLALRKLDDEQFHFAEGGVALSEEFFGGVGVVGDDADDGVVAGFVHADGADLDGRAVEVCEQLVELADAVVQEDAELRDCWRRVSLCCFQSQYRFAHVRSH